VDVLLDAGKPEGLLPIGLGARDSLRFEACLPLYGHEISVHISPLRRIWAVLSDWTSRSSEEMRWRP
jgi:glycine cleavage system aminomethyltransferase T